MEKPNTLFSIIDGFLFEDKESVLLDIYYNDHGHPKYLHDLIGGTAASELLSEILVKEISTRNNQKNIWKVSGYGYAIVHRKCNSLGLLLNIKGIEHQILKKTIEINLKNS